MNILKGFSDITHFWLSSIKLSYKTSKNSFRKLIWMQNSIECLLPNYEIPQLSSHYWTLNISLQILAIYMAVAVSTKRYRAVCHPLMWRHAYYKYLIVVIFLSVTIEFPRFFEMKLNKDKSQYWTTDLMENPDYVQFNSYWNDIIVTGLLPLVLLCYMNLRVFVKIKVRIDVLSSQN